MRQLQNDPEKIRSFYQNHRSNMPPDGAFTYGLINRSNLEWDMPTDNGLIRHALENGWLPNIVVSVLILAMTQLSWRGVVVACIAMVIILVTGARFRHDSSQTAQLRSPFRVAMTIGYVVGVFCIVVSVFWPLRAPLADVMPTHTVNVVKSHIELTARNHPRIHAPTAKRPRKNQVFLPKTIAQICRLKVHLLMD